jgi:hypothetical protein
MIRRRRPLLRAAVVGGGAYVAGKRAARGSAERSDQDERISNLEQQQAADPANAQAAGSGTTDPSMLDQLNQLTTLHQQGALTDGEFAAAKAQLLGT